jgi:2-(1,2-epoxy-1,2-dihydrophenyl)acetyl-CoA isomerase
MNYVGAAGLDVTAANSVLRLTLNRPEAHNSITHVMVDAMIACLDSAGQDETVRVIVLDAVGKSFCSGSDLAPATERPERRPRVGTIQRRLPSKANRLIPLMLEVQTPIVSVVRGWAAGLGFHLALASDFCIAADDARFWEPFIARGFSPDSAGSWLLPRLVGVVRTRELIMLGRELSGAEAAAWGLVHAAVPSAQLGAEADALIEKLASGPTVALGLAKWLLNTGAELGLDHHLRNEALALELSMRSEDFKEGTAAFVQRRAARFEGR